MEKEKNSVLKEAFMEYNTIMEAAKANAKKKLAEEYHEDFNKLLKEELKNNKKSKESNAKMDESKESKKIDESDLNKENTMKKEIEETKKVQEEAGDGKPFTEKPKKEAEGDAVEEAVKVTDTVGDGKPFTEKTEKGKKDDKDKKVNESEDEMGEKEEEKEVSEQAGEGKPFTEKPKKDAAATAVEPKQADQSVVNETEEFDVTQLDVDSVGSAVESANEGDEFLTMEAIEKELANLEERDESFIEPNAEIPKGDGGVAYTEKLKGLKDQIDEMLAGLEEQKKHGGKQNYKGREKGGPTTAMIDEENVAEMHKMGDGDGSTSYGTDAQIAAQHKDGPTDKLIDEEDVITNDELDAVLNQVSEEEVDEASGMAHSSSKHVAGDHLPGKDFAPQRHKRSGSYNNESAEKKISSLIEENKKLTKKVNEAKKYKESATKLLEGYKSGLEKYRTQLKEMAVFNTNLAHVNNLLVNEELALTQDDKIKIINEFKKVDNITESQTRYKEFLNEMKESKKNLTESIEGKVSASVQPSSAQKIDEVVESTAYENNEHIKKMKKLIEYVETRGKKKIIK